MTNEVLQLVWTAIVLSAFISFAAFLLFFAWIALKQGNQRSGFISLAHLAYPTKRQRIFNIVASIGFGVCIYMGANRLLSTVLGHVEGDSITNGFAAFLAFMAFGAFAMFFDRLFTNIATAHCESLSRLTELEVMTLGNSEKDLERLKARYSDCRSELRATGLGFDSEISYIFAKRISEIEELQGLSKLEGIELSLGAKKLRERYIDRVRDLSVSRNLSDKSLISAYRYRSKDESGKLIVVTENTGIG